MTIIVSGELGWLALTAAVSELTIGANTVFSKQIRYNATQSTIALWAASVVANVVMIFLFREGHPAIGWHIEYVYLVFFAIASVIASWSLIKGVKLIEAGAAGILGLLEIVFGVLFGIVFFHERPGALVLTGVIIIIVAALIPYIKTTMPSAVP